ncbi:MAG: hypothetical protein ACOY4K_17485 [Pseudomonadota bacterium]
MPYFMARTFDNGGYYETRLILAAGVMGLALWMWRRGGDRRYLIAFLFGGLFQGVMEFLIAQGGLRGAGYGLQLFGQAVPRPWAFLLQGVVEGGPLAVMAFWFADLLGDRAPARRWAPYLAALAGVVILSIVVVATGGGDTPTSMRPIFRWDWIWFSLVAGSIVLTAVFRRLAGLRRLALFAAGVVIYLVATYEPMHVAGVRLIVEKTAAGAHPAGLWPQIWVMAYSHLVEVTGSKLHYFAIPLLLGLLDRRERT